MVASSAQYIAYRFGSFVLNLERGALLAAADGREVPLRPKSFALLQLLAENAGRLLAQEAIMDALWPDVVVTGNSVTQCVHDIRVALGSEAHQTLRTLPRRGYLFTSDVIAVPPADPSSHGDHMHRHVRNGSMPSAWPLLCAGCGSRPLMRTVESLPSNMSLGARSSAV